MKKNPLFVDIANQLTQMIQEKYPPGSKIPIEPELMEMFGVSRTTIRSAISSLCSKNILEIRRGDGTYVTNSPGFTKDALGIQFLSPDKAAHDIGEMSILIQPAAASLAADRRTEIDLERMVNAINYLEDGWQLYLNGSSDYSDLRQRDSQFHSAVMRASHNHIIERVTSVFQEYNENNREHRNINVIKDSLSMHTKIYNAILKGQQTEAERLMLEHMTNVNNYFDKDLYPEEEY